MNLLNEDNVVHVFLNKLGDIVIANLLFILCCIPVITIGPSLTALYHCMMRTVKGNNNGTTKTFFRAFKENFKQSLAADPCCRSRDHPEYPLSAPCRRKRCTYTVLSFCRSSDSADNFYFIHIPGDRNLCQYTRGTLQKCISAGIYALPHNDRHCGDHDLSIVYDLSRCKAAASLRVLLVFLWIWTCSFYKFDAVVSIF